MKKEYIITVLNEPKAKAKQRWPVRPSKKSKYLARRGSLRWNFWDLGLVSTGPDANDWTMLDFQPDICPFDTSSNSFDTTYTQQLQDKIFEQPVTSWATYYKRIVPGMDYGLSVSSNSVLDNSQLGSAQILDSSNTNFTNAGLKPPNEWFGADSQYVPNIGIAVTESYIAFRITRFGSRSATGNKVTTSYDITAPAVTFTPARKMDVFLVPALPYIKCRLEYELSGTYNYQELDEFFWLYDRNIFLTPSHALYNWNGNHFVSGLGAVNNRSTELGNSSDYADFVSGYNWIRDNVPSSRGRYAINTLPYTSSDDGSAFGYSTYLGRHPPAGDSTWYAEADLSGNSASEFTPGTSDHQTLLRCVIKQNGTYYYVWNEAYS